MALEVEMAKFVNQVVRKRIQIPEPLQIMFYTICAGKVPDLEYDDLERAFCPLAGEIGHYNCGFCDNCGAPRWSCACHPEVKYASKSD
jgi:hypothetical protein